MSQTLRFLNLIFLIRLPQAAKVGCGLFSSEVFTVFSPVSSVINHDTASPSIQNRLAELSILTKTTKMIQELHFRAPRVYKT